MVVHILLYAPDVWSCENTDTINHFQLKFCKLLLVLKESKPDIMIYGTLGMTLYVYVQGTHVKSYNMINQYVPVFHCLYIIKV